MDTKRLQQCLDSAFDAQFERIFNDFCLSLASGNAPDAAERAFQTNFDTILEAEERAKDFLGLGPKKVKAK